MPVLWFKGPDGNPFRVQCQLGIHVPRLADKLHLKASPLELNGVVVDFDSSTGYMVDTTFLADCGATPDSAIQVTGQPVGEHSNQLRVLQRVVLGSTRMSRLQPRCCCWSVQQALHHNPHKQHRDMATMSMSRSVQAVPSQGHHKPYG